MKPQMIPTDLRKWEERAAATRMADALLRADRRRARRMAANDELGGLNKKAAPTVAGPQHLHLSDLKSALAHRPHLVGAVEAGWHIARTTRARGIARSQLSRKENLK
jgi:hypothetical protein